ncbi:outer membrane beta-barrel protein [Colwellia sp. MB02u-14]|uniref:outer membrane beta-barrel protein n=1 Tax=Colwellia sp. MB02u-14 TaxID=2759815 RepID=UPI0015F5ED86|nr:outer membrane beta-barrel protein [Colwellia sp. MB02u-14]MBA6302405.1 outer membrane beta-barrel protein [Colwellia sp. MB02u-14]
MLKSSLAIVLILISSKIWSAESTFKGIIDVRAYYVNNTRHAQSYLQGGYGKFRYNAGSGLALGQLGLQYQLSWDNNWSAMIVANAFADKENINIGLTEGYLQYKGLPNVQGWRIKSKIGVFYPQISMENVSTAWSTPYTLASSSLNNWIGEELRSTGINFTIEKLGKATKSPHTFSMDFALFQNNDSAGAMLTWHGWTMGSRQTLLQEKLTVQNFPARNATLSEQAANSDPFIELDNRLGGHFSVTWRYQNALKVNLGFYDNQAEEGLVEEGQYTWTTTFSHLGIKYKVAPQWEIIGQYMQGNTDMKSPYGVDIVNGKFNNAFVLIRKKWQSSHLAFRLEHFDVDDRDDTLGDNNNESGNGASLAYRYKLTQHSFVMVEYNWLKSDRPSRHYEHQAVELIERQYQLAYRYYF